MGLRSDTAGISVQLYDEENKPAGAPHFGAFTELRSTARSNVVESSGTLSAEENAAQGSEDWLTLIAVADTEERLNAILKSTAVPKTLAETSAASRRVLVELHVGGVRKTLEKRIVIASGPIVSKEIESPNEPATINVVHVKVLHEDAQMNGSNPLIDEFEGMSPR